MLDLNIQFKITKENKIVPATPGDKMRLDLYVKSLHAGTVLDSYFTVINDNNKTLAQLQKVHAMIRDLSLQIGISFNDLKTEIKTRAGLYNVIDSETGEKEVKSFANCSKDELNSAIEECMIIDNFLNNHY